jgi:diketogulonate reductase-like aldo/keto reductase
MPLRADRVVIRAFSTSISSNMTSLSPFAPKSGEKLTLTSSIKLQDGTSQPRFGIGAWAMRGQEAYKALLGSLQDVGYRSIDTAKYYQNETEVGQAIRDSGIPRSDIYATTKLFTGAMGGGLKTEKAYQDSLDKSGLDYWDLVLLHAPDGGKEFRLKTWETLTKYVESGQIKSLGVSNFGIHHIDEMVQANLKVKPVVNQIECHPFFAQRELRKKCEENGIVVQAYCPLARGRYYGDKTLVDVAKRNDKSEAQVMLRWLLQHGIIPLPKSSNPQRQKENAESLDFELSSEDMKGEQEQSIRRDDDLTSVSTALDSLDRGQRGAVESQTLSQNAP